MLLKPLTEGERWLWRVLTDPKFFADFFWTEPDGTTPYRVRDYQRRLTSDSDKMTGEFARDTGKTESIKRRAICKIFEKPSEGHLITAPQEVHLGLLMDSILERIEQCEFTREMLAGRPTRSPGKITIKFKNGHKTYGRIPGAAGNNCKGQHVPDIDVDEGQDYSEEGWSNLWDCLNPGGTIRVFGVHNGVRNTYFSIVKNEEWDRISISACHKYTWGKRERNQKISMHGGSRKSPAYIRNVMAKPGDAEYPLFLHSRLMKNVDLGKKGPEGARNREEPEWTRDYTHQRLVAENIKGDVADYVKVLSGYKDYPELYAGIDTGYVSDPTEIGVWASTAIQGQPRYKLVYRLTLERFEEPQQKSAIEKLFKKLPNLQVMAFEVVGRGGALLAMMKDSPYRSLCIPVDFRSTEAVLIKEDGTEVRRSVKQIATEKIQALVDNQMLMIPWDSELINDLLYQRETPKRGGKVDYTGERDHFLDSMRVMFFEIETEYGKRTQEEQQQPFVGGWLGQTKTVGAFT